MKKRKLRFGAFKPDTDDVRCSVAVELVEKLVEEGAEVIVYDPKALGKFQELPISKKVTLADSPEAAVESTEALIIATEWTEFGNADFKRVKESMVAPLIFDGRNLLDPATMIGMGFTYQGIGRGTTPEIEG